MTTRSTVFEYENVEDGVWLHTKNPSTQETNRIKVTLGSDGIILDVWTESLPDDPIQSIGLTWNCDLAPEEV